jgi:tRNA-specific 2-thiouridylase
MPVGEYTKEEIRAIATEIGLCIAQKPDSQEICFVPDDNYANFIEEYTGKKILEGNFVDTKGNIIGRHKGIIHYTIGQRKGLGIALGKPAFVVEIRSETNEVVIGSNDDVFACSLIANNLNAMSVAEFVDGMEVMAKIRYNHEGAPCRITKQSDDEIRCDFKQPQRAITPGQAVVFYDGDLVVGGGCIVKAI